MSAPWHVHSIGFTILLYGIGQVIGITVGPWLGIRDHVLFGVWATFSLSSAFMDLVDRFDAWRAAQSIDGLRSGALLIGNECVTLIEEGYQRVSG